MSDGPILAECKVLLEELRQTYEGDPAAERRRLGLLALEREQLVSYAYRQDILGQRLDNLVAPPEVIRVMHHAFTQVWRDEEAHTVLVRGTVIDDESGVRGLTRMTIEQTSGWLAGWSSALKHHVPRSSAPLRSTLVDGLGHAARMVGKLSSDLRAELKHKTFREFCVYNVDAEATAELCWLRIIELETLLEGSDVEAFQRIAREEREHGLVFDAVANVLDPYDWLIGETTPESLAATLATIGARFAPPDLRPANPGSPSPALFGSGAPVRVFHESSHSRHAAVDASLDLLGDIDGRSVMILTSWMMGYSRRDPSSVIDPDFLFHLVEELQNRGARPTVADAPNLYSDLYSNRDVPQVAAHFGIEPNCPVVDATAERMSVEFPPILGPATISTSWLQADIRISTVRLRSHPREHLHGCTANLESLVPGTAENVFWQRRYDHSVAALSSAIVAPPHLSLLDAWDNCPDGLFGIMAGSHVVHPKRLYASTDALSCDLVAMRHTGSSRSVNSPTLRRAIEWFGDSRSSIDIIGLDEDIDDWRNPHDTTRSGFLADLAYPVFAYLSRSGAVFAPPMDDEFVEKTQLPLPVRALRKTARRLLGLRPAAHTR